MEDDDNARRNAEYAALQAIYADALEGDAAGPWRIDLGHNATFECWLPDDYPSSSPPTPVLHIPALSETDRVALVSELCNIYDGCEVVYSWTEHLREALAQRAEAATTTAEVRPKNRTNPFPV